MDYISSLAVLVKLRVVADEGEMEIRGVAVIKESSKRPWFSHYEGGHEIQSYTCSSNGKLPSIPTKAITAAKINSIKYTTVGII